MAEKKSTKPKFTFKDPTPKELKEMYPDDTEREAAQAAMEKRKIKEETEANKGKQTPSEAKAMLENKKKGMKAGGSVKKCKRDGIAVRGRTKGRMV